MARQGERKFAETSSTRRPARCGSHPHVREAEGHRPPLLRAAALCVAGRDGTTRRKSPQVPAPGRTVPKPKTAAVGAPKRRCAMDRKPSREPPITRADRRAPAPRCEATGAQLGLIGAARTIWRWLFDMWIDHRPCPARDAARSGASQMRDPGVAHRNAAGGKPGPRICAAALHAAARTG